MSVSVKNYTLKGLNFGYFIIFIWMILVNVMRKEVIVVLLVIYLIYYMVIVITNLLPFQGDVSPAANINRKSVEPNWVMECNNVAIRCFFSESKDGFLTQFTTKK